MTTPPSDPAGKRNIVDEMSEASFPASDPPAVWTWDVDRPPGAVRPDRAAAPAFRDNAELSRYEAHVGGELAGWLEHRPAGERVILAHTEVLERYEGRGLGGELVRYALAAAQAAGQPVIVTCPFAAAYLERHPELRGARG